MLLWMSLTVILVHLSCRSKFLSSISLRGMDSMTSAAIVKSRMGLM